MSSENKTSVIPVSICQVLKVSQVSQEELDAQGWMVRKEKGETLVLEANLGLKVNICGSLFLYCLWA